MIEASIKSLVGAMRGASCSNRTVQGTLLAVESTTITVTTFSLAMDASFVSPIFPSDE